MQQWKKEIVERICLPKLAEGLFNLAWDNLTHDDQVALVGGGNPPVDRQFVVLVFNLSGWTPTEELGTLPASPAKYCAALMEFGSSAYTGLVTKEMEAAYAGRASEFKPHSYEERVQQRNALTDFTENYGDYAVKLILYGYDVGGIIPHELAGRPPKDWKRKIQWVDHLVGIYEAALKPADVTSFRGIYQCFSNFSPHPVRYCGVKYPCVECAFQAAKTLDEEAREPFTKCTPAEAKKMGRKLKLRKDWEQVKYDIMYELLCQKFAKGTECRRILDRTGDAYICEGNTWHDNVWGDCKCDRCVHVHGLNHMGKLLMRIRDNL